MKYGCVRFEDPYQHDTGWAARAGEPSFRVSSQTELPSDTVWLTNLDYNLMSSSGFTSHARFRRVDFAGEPFWKQPTKGGQESPVDYTHYTMSNVMGCGESEWQEQTEVLSNIFSRVVLGLNHLINSNDSVSHSMSACVRRALAPHDPMFGKRVTEGLDEAVVNFVRCEALNDMYAPGVRGLTLSIPKVTHAQNILQVPVPMGGWKAVNKKSIPDQKEYIEWLLDMEQPFLANITVNRSDPDFGRLLNFGSGKERRSWVTTHELNVLASSCDITIHSGYMAEGSGVFDAITEAVNQIKPMMIISPSVGLMFENLWVGLATKMTPPAHILKDKYATNPAAPFLRAVDRLECLKMARALDEEDVGVVSYGKGKISILTDKTDKEIAAICRKVGVIPPFLDIPTQQDTVDKKFLSTPIGALQAMYIRGERDLLRSTDERIVNNLMNGKK